MSAASAKLIADIGAANGCFALAQRAACTFLANLPSGIAGRATRNTC